MKWLIKSAIVWCLVAECTMVSATTYYVAPTGGNNLNSGTIDKPWATWQKAFDSARAGDTVYFRGGIWQPAAMPILNPSIGHGSKGTYADPICFFNYPGEIPILDCGQYPYTKDKEALQVWNTTYVKFRGLTIRNNQQIVYGQWVSGMSILYNGTIHLDRMTITNMGGYGFWTGSTDTLYFINCDSYNNYDALADDPGNRSDGYQISMGTSADSSKYLYMYGCRAWNNSDDGFEISAGYNVEISNCWSFGNGRLESGAGAGLKFTTSQVSIASKRKIHNNISAFNRGYGISHQNLFDTNHGPVGEFLNNSIYNTSLGFSDDPGAYDCTVGSANTVHHNNIVYASKYKIYQAYLQTCEYQPEVGPAYNSESHNSWRKLMASPYWEVNPTFTITDADFVSLDSTGMSGARGPDGSLPQINFMRLAAGSDLIDAGIDVGLPFIGNAPDLGYSEYPYSEVPTAPVYLNSAIELLMPSRLEMAYNLTLANIVPATSAFTVKVNSVTRTVTSVAISGTKVLLTLASPVAYGDAVTVAYTRPSTNPLQTSAGGQAASITAQNVANNVTAETPVYVSSVIENVTPSKLEITYNLALTNIVPAASAFTVKVNTLNRSVSSVIISGTKVLLTLSSAVVFGDAVTVAYTKPSVNPLQTSGGGQAASIIAQSVINNCSLIANEPPVINITAPTKSVTFIAPATITIEAIVSDPDGSINKVEFYSGNNKIGEIVSSPYSYTWKNVSEGNYILTAIATDNSNAKTVSEPVSAIVEKSATAVNQLPTVTIISPNTKKKYKKNDRIVFEALASDSDGSISKVEFKCGSTTLAEITSPPFTYTWEAIDTGTFVITALAIDNLGATSLSPGIELHVAELYDVNPDIINLYPNPNNGKFTIDLNTGLSDPNYKMTIISLSGITVYSDILNNQEGFKECDLTGSLGGTYILMVTNGNKIVATKKFIKR